MEKSIKSTDGKMIFMEDYGCGGPGIDSTKSTLPLFTSTRQPSASTLVSFVCEPVKVCEHAEDIGMLCVSAGPPRAQAAPDNMNPETSAASWPQPADFIAGPFSSGHFCTG
jgi:hypothetical protein